MNSEYERKFLLVGYPHIFDLFKMERIKQWYISRPEDLIEVRIRLYDDGRCYVDFKKGFGMERYEHGFKCLYDDVKHLTEGVPFVEKDRFKLRTDEYLLIVDEFTDGLRLVEIESNSVEFIKNFVPFDWMGLEVTDNLHYTNNWLAWNKEKR